jgi:ferritin-like metal-binding protein YciE
MAKAASSNELRAGFEKHLEQTKGHIQRLEEIVQSLDESPKGKKCVGMEGLVKEGSEVMAEDFDDVVLDAGLIGAARRVEHYEMAAYAAVYEFAMVLGQTRQASLLERTLAEEKQTDDKLAELARKINAQANEEGLEEEQGAPRSAHKTPKRAA